MYSRPKRNWGIIALVSILGVYNIALMNTLVTKKIKNPFPNVNVPVGPYTSYDIVATDNGYRISYKANDPKILHRTKYLSEPKGFFGNKESTLSLKETYTMQGGGQQEVERTVMNDKKVACNKSHGYQFKSGPNVYGSLKAK